jgi:addiction module HigA family antidote
VLPGLGLSVSQSARDLGIARQTLHRILAGRAPITPDMAARLGKFCGVSPRFWLKQQCEYDLHRAEAGAGIALERVRAHALARHIMEKIGAVDD